MTVESGAVGPKRLAKVAKDLNVGLDTIIGHLSTVGIVIDKNPNAKLDENAYFELLKKFQPDKLDREKSNALNLTPNIAKVEDKKKNETHHSPALEPSIAENKKTTVQDEAPEPEEESTLRIRVVGNIDLDSLNRKSSKSSATKKEKTEDIPLKVQPAPTPVPELLVTEPAKTIVVEEVPVIKKEETIPTPKKEKESPIKTEIPPLKSSSEPIELEFKEAEVIESVKPLEVKATEGVKYIDLDAINEKELRSRKKVTKKETELKEKEAAKKTSKAKSAASDKAVAEAPKIEEIPVQEIKVEIESAEVAEKKVEHIETKLEKHDGLTVLGKIDLASLNRPTSFKGKKPAEKPGDKRPRERKKVVPAGNRVDVGAASNRPPQTGPGQQNNDQNRGGFNNRTGTGGNQQGGGYQGGGGGYQGGNNNNQGGGYNRPNYNPNGPQTPGVGGNNNSGNNFNRPGGNNGGGNFPPRPQQYQNLPSIGGGHNRNNKRRGNSKTKKTRNRARQAEENSRIQGDSDLIIVTEFITVNELASIMNVSPMEVIGACLALGVMVSINQRLDAEMIEMVASEFDLRVEFRSAEMDEPSLEEPDSPDNIAERPPIVTIMGHVDHGKTSLLDYIRNANVVAGEAGGITQHIGAYEVTLDSGRKIAFLDTPGHEAFTAMRARGAKVTDIVIVVIAADDSVMPQTREAISHSLAAGVPIVFAFNKIDKAGADTEKIRSELSNMNILVEEWGGKYQTQEISAKKGLNIELLLEKVLLEADILDLKADAKKRATGTILEASLDKGKGIVATLMVQTGTLRVGDTILAGANHGKVRALMNERGIKIKEAGPSTPVQVLGFDGPPTAGDRMYVTENEQVAKSIATKRKQLIREQGIRATKHITLEEIGRRLKIGSFKELNLIIKGDVDGSVEALADSLIRLSTEEVKVNVILKAVGQITESDVLLASASDAIIIGFQVRPSATARKLAESEQIDIRLYSIIYDAINEIKLAMEGLLAPDSEEKVTGTVEIREVFKITKVGAVAGCYVTEGKISRNNEIRLIRNGVVTFTGKIATLKRFKDDVKDVAAGYECGIQIENYNDIKEGDVIESFETIEVARKL